MSSRRDTATSASTGAAIQAAWREGRLTGGSRPTSAAGTPARVELLGVGETYAAWRLRASGAVDLTVRVLTREPDDLPRPMSNEVAALAHVPPGLGPRLVTACRADGQDSPLGAPYLVTSHLPGQVLAPHRWRPEHLRTHAVTVAGLHRDRFAGRGAFADPDDPAATLETGPMSLLSEFDTAMRWWRDQHPAVLADPALSRLVATARSVVGAADHAFADLDSYTLAHGDLCATNVVWDGSACRYIDFEWAQADDPARDLAIIGGPVHAGPWYLPLDDAAVDVFLADYRRASARLGHPIDAAALRCRRDAWEAYERTAMLLHLTRRAQQGRTGYARIAGHLAVRLAATLRARGAG